VKQPVFDALRIQTMACANKVDYSFEVSSKGVRTTTRDARLVLSDGQLTATALALFFGLAESTAHEIDLLYVDDPTQNLDLPCKEAMAKLIAEMARRRQIIVSTQDEDFVSFLDAAGFQRGAVVHHLKAWDGNPTVETFRPELRAWHRRAPSRPRSSSPPGVECGCRRAEGRGCAAAEILAVLFGWRNARWMAAGYSPSTQSRIRGRETGGFCAAKAALLLASRARDVLGWTPAPCRVDVVRLPGCIETVSRT